MLKITQDVTATKYYISMILDSQRFRTAKTTNDLTFKVN